MKITAENIFATLVRRSPSEIEDYSGQLEDFAIEVEMIDGTAVLEFAEDSIFLFGYPGMQMGQGPDGEVDQDRFNSFVGTELISPTDLDSDEKIKYDDLISTYLESIERVSNAPDIPSKSQA